MRRTFCTILLGLSSFCTVSNAQTPEFLDVNEAVVRALGQNLSLRIQGVEVILEQQDVIIEEAAFDTRFFASGTQRGSRAAGYGGIEGNSSHNSLMRAGISKLLNTGAEVQVTSNYARNSISGSSQILNPAHTSDVSMSLRQPLLRAAGSDFNLIALQNAQLAVERSQFDLRQTALNLMGDTEFAYWDLAYAHEVKKVRLASLEVAEKLLEENEARESVGVATNIDVLQSQVFLATSQEAVITADALIDTSQDTLFRQMGSYEYPGSYVPVSPLPDISTEEVGTQTSMLTILANNPSYLAQELRLTFLDRLVKAARSRMLPTVDLVAGMGFSGLDDSLTDSYGNTLERDGYDWTAGIEFSIPWGQRLGKAELQRTRSLLHQEQLRVEDLEQDLKVVNRRNWRNWVTGVERVRAAKLSLDLASQQFSREQSKYEEGLATFRELLESREDQDEANLRYLSSILDALKAQIINSSLDASLPQRYGLSWDSTNSLISPEEATDE